MKSIDKFSFTNILSAAPKVSFIFGLIFFSFTEILHARVLTSTATLLIPIYSDSTYVTQAKPVNPTDTISIIEPAETTAPDDIHCNENAITEEPDSLNLKTESDISPLPRSDNPAADLSRLSDTTHDVSISEFAIPAGVFAAASLFVRTPKLVQAREYVQKHVSHHGQDKTKIDNYIQYAPMIVGYGLDFCGVRSRHGLLDRTILLAISYSTFIIATYTAKTAFSEQRPDSSSRNSFPSYHTGTAFMGAEFLRREYLHESKWIGFAGYAVAAGIGYLRIHNDRHWINDIVGGAALGYLSTTFAYWIYPKIFRKRATIHRDELLQRTDAPAKENRVAWVASPFAQNGTYGVAASVIF